MEHLAASDPPAESLELATPIVLSASEDQIAQNISANLGVHKSYAEQGIYFSKKMVPPPQGEVLETEATAWVLENHPRFLEDDDDLGDMEASDGAPAEAGLKMVIVVNTELPMSPGKMAAQVAHGAVNLYMEMSNDPSCIPFVQQWLTDGSKKIVLAAKNAQHIFELKDKAASAQLKFTLITDAGLTQIASGSVTCLALFGLGSDVNAITGNLQLL